MEYFSLKELGAKSEDEFHPGVLDELDLLREKVGEPMHPTSGPRTEFHNIEVGGHPKSLHIWDYPKQKGQKGCMAVDINTYRRPLFKAKLVEAALSLGWSVGINDKRGFVHIDRRVDIGLPKAVFSY